VKQIYPRILELGGEVVAISFSPPSRLAAFLEKYPLPFAAVSDPERQAYRALSLENTSWKVILRPASVFRYLRLIFKGWLPKSPGQEDLMQLGGDFILDDQRRLVYAYRSAEPTDRPPTRDLLKAIASAV
jgi:peroxiredoxin